jgi:hypothetical protein
MSRRQFTTLTLQVQLRQPSTMTQAQVVEAVKEMFTSNVYSPNLASSSNSVILVKKETTYL